MAFERYSKSEALNEAGKMQGKMAEAKGFYQEAERLVEVDRGREKIVQIAAGDVEAKYRELGYHNPDHTQGVRDRTREILLAIQKGSPELVTGATLTIADIAAVSHDRSVDSYDAVILEGDFAKTVARRWPELDEAISTQAMVELMKKINAERRQAGVPVVFTEQDIQNASEGVMATVPGFDPKIGTVIQPRLKADTGVIARSIALADIGEAGMDTPSFLRTGNNLFKEENLDIMEALVSGKEISPELKEYFKKRILGWTNFQPVFAGGRKKLLENELGNLPEAAREEVKKLFAHFDESVEAAKQVAARRANMSFEQLVDDMGLRKSQAEQERDFRQAA